jgi:hypothetical protein
MVRSKYLFSSVVAAFFATTLLLRADLPREGYLPNVGPVSLRFLASEKPFKSIVISKATNSIDSAEQTDAIPLPSPKEELIQTPLPPVNEPAITGKTNVVIDPLANNPASESQPKSEPAQEPEATISPQMLLKFFNRPPTFVAPSAAPVEFKAPQPAAPSSKATYSISP